jgi:predicted metal-dependent hydrolase
MMPAVQLRFPWSAPSPPPAPRRAPTTLEIAGYVFPLLLARHRRARRYLLRLTDEGQLRLTVPRGASIAGGVRFVESQADWIAREWGRRQTHADWQDGTRIWYRGALVSLHVEGGRVRWGDQVMAVASDLATRAAVQRHLRQRATIELVARCRELGETTGLVPDRVAVRDQRSRWGSCSRRRSVMLNWRLIQMPPDVSDYVILHELAHLEQPNHSRRFWRVVARICPDWRTSERWLRRHGRDLL